MNLPSIWKLALGFLIVSYLFSVLRSYWRLRHIRGPWLGAVSELWYIKAATSGQLHLKLAEVCSKNGKSTREDNRLGVIAHTESTRRHCKNRTKHSDYLE